MEYILEDLYTIDYYNLIMLELPKLLEAKEIDVKEFFKASEEQYEVGDDEDNNQLPLTIEKMIDDDKLITFTPIPINFLNLHEFKNIHQKEIESEITEKLIERDKKVLQDSKDKENFEI